MFKSNLFLKTFTTIVVGILLLTGTYYMFSVPMINKMAFEMEERASRNVLDNMYLMIKQSHQDMQSWKDSALDAHKRQLRNIIEVMVSYINLMEAEAESGAIRRTVAKGRVLDIIRSLKYGNNDYIWVSDYNNVLISHPDPKLHNQDFSNVKDVNGDLIVPPMVKGALKDGDGFYSYWWRRLGEENPVEKLSYYRNIPSWGWVIGTGLYIDDINLKVEQRRLELIEELRRHLKSIRIAGNGYLYIFDSNLNMIIHPNENIEDTNIANLLNPVTRKPIAQELIEASRRPDRKFEYKWDKPSDPGNYIYDKISWVSYFKGNDWYICSSVYKEDLKSSAQALTRRILMVSGLALVLSILGSYLFVQTLTTPIKRLAESANRISRGDLTYTANIVRDDEIGVLSRAFNNMVEQLRDQIKNLEQRVADRTSELTGKLGELEKQNQEFETIKSMGDMLQACRSTDEIYSVISKSAQNLFPDSSGNILILDTQYNSIEFAGAWGRASTRPPASLDSNDCWSLRRGTIYAMQNVQFNQVCPHVDRDVLGNGSYICVPMIAQGETLGILHVILHGDGTAQSGENITVSMKRLAGTVAEHAGLSLANMQLQQTLHSQSIRDPLTGLFNRRYMEEVLVQAQHRALRQKSSVGIIILDVDHFKGFNDRYGHEAGDVVLRELGTMLMKHFREGDIACRFGGEEFVVVLPDASKQNCIQRAEALRKEIETGLRIKWRNNDLVITISCGVSVFPEDGVTAKDALEGADSALLRAKQEGRNRVIHA